MSSNSSDGCASGCGGCLLILVGAALVAAGPAGWILALVIVAMLLALGADRSKHRTAALRRQSRPCYGSAFQVAGRIEPIPALPPDPATEAAVILGRDSVGADSDRELDQLLADARRAVDKAM